MQQAQVATHFDDRDASRKAGRSLVRIRIVNERALNLVLGENTRVEGPGECIVEVWSNEVPGVLKMVEDDKAGIQMAEQALRTDLARQAIELCEDADLRTLGPEEFLARLGSNHKADAAWKRAEKTTALSVQGHFNRLKGRDMRPLSKAEVLEENVASPYQKLEIAHAKTISKAMSNEAPAAKK